jgi:hypothetical protein
MRCKEGDWVLFQQNNLLVIGIVLKRERERDKLMGELKVYTTVGSVGENAVLERREARTPRSANAAPTRGA